MFGLSETFAITATAAVDQPCVTIPRWSPTCHTAGSRQKDQDESVSVWAERVPTIRRTHRRPSLELLAMAGCYNQAWV
jgi:hypothetical protein